VNKKKQKNFVNWSAPTVAGVLQAIKSFLLLFFKKDASCFASTYSSDGHLWTAENG